MSNTTETQEAPAFDGSIEQAVGLITMPEEPEQVEQEEITESEDATPEVEASDSEDVDDAEDDDGEEEVAEVETEDDDENDSEEPTDQQEQTFEVKVDGVVKRVTLDELTRGYSGQEYVQKGMQDVAAKRKQTEEVYSHLIAERKNLVDFYNQLESGQFQIVEPTPPDDSMAQVDPIGWIEQKASYEKKLKQFQTDKAKMSELKQQAQMADQRALQVYMEQEMTSLKNVIPEFGDAQKASKLKDQLINGGQNYYGYSQDEIGQIMDHRAIRVLNDAIKYREIVAGKSKADAKAKGAKPVIKPGAKKAQNPSRKAMERQKARLKNSGRIEDAIALIVNE